MPKGVATNGNLLIFGLPFGASNKELMRRLGVAIYSDGYTNSQRLQIINGTLAYNENDPELNNFQAVFSTSSDASTRDFYLGAFQLNDTQWFRLQAWIPSAPNGLKYARIDTDSHMLTADHNVNALTPYVGQSNPPLALIALAGLRRYDPTP